MRSGPALSSAPPQGGGDTPQVAARGGRARCSGGLGREGSGALAAVPLRANTCGFPELGPGAPVRVGFPTSGPGGTSKAPRASSGVWL